MRLAFLAALAPLLLPASSSGGESAVSVRDLEFTVRDLAFKTVDLVLEQSEVRTLSIEETETEIRIEIPAEVLFDLDKSDIRDDAAVALDQVADIIRAHPGKPVRIEGHTDATGSKDYNQRLSEDRARSVKDWLAQGKGFDAAAFAVTGLGETSPAAPNENADGADDPEGRQKNRRVEIVIGK